MDYSKLQLFQMMQKKMNYHSERQQVLSQNVANADTPYYQPKDVEPLSFEDTLSNSQKKLAMTRTAPQHSEGISYRMPDYEVEKREKNFEIKPVKNAVNVEEQMMEISNNAFAYQTTTMLYRKTTDLFKTAIGKQ